MRSGATEKGWRDSASSGATEKGGYREGGEGEAQISLGTRKLLGGLKIGSTGFILSYREVK
jgi:hypothetical protein